MLLLLVAMPGANGNFNDEGCFSYGLELPCPADSKHHIYFYLGLPGRFVTATETSRLQSYDQGGGWTTVQTTHHDSSDAHFMDDNLPPGAVGEYTCSVLYGGGRCDHAHIRYDVAAADDLSDDELQSLACHETGHSVGLSHPEDDGQPDDPNVYHCMVIDGWPRFLGSHNVWHLQSPPFYS